MIDCSYTDEIVCPHCGYSHTESYEFFVNNGECADGCSCSDCGREFDATREVSITYSTVAVAEPPDREAGGE